MTPILDCPWAGLAVTGLLSHHTMPFYPFWPSFPQPWAWTWSWWQTCSVQCYPAGLLYFLQDLPLLAKQSKRRQLVTQSAGFTSLQRFLCQTFQNWKGDTYTHGGVEKWVVRRSMDLNASCSFTKTLVRMTVIDSDFSQCWPISQKWPQRKSELVQVCCVLTS